MCLAAWGRVLQPACAAFHLRTGGSPSSHPPACRPAQRARVAPLRRRRAVEPRPPADAAAQPAQAAAARRRGRGARGPGGRRRRAATPAPRLSGGHRHGQGGRGLGVGGWEGGGLDREGGGWVPHTRCISSLPPWSSLPSRFAGLSLAPQTLNPVPHSPPCARRTCANTCRTTSGRGASEGLAALPPARLPWPAWHPAVGRLLITQRL